MLDKKILLHFKTRVILYGPKQLMSIQKIELEMPHSEYSILTLYEAFSGLFSDKKAGFSE